MADKQVNFQINITGNAESKAQSLAKNTEVVASKVEPTYQISLHDEQYQEKNGKYYVLATETNFNSSGGSRKISLGRRLQ